MIAKRVTTLALGLALIFGGVIAPLHANAKDISTQISCCADGGPGDGLPW